LHHCINRTTLTYHSRTIVSLLSLAVFSVVVPAAFVASAGSTGVDEKGVLAISRGVAIVLLICYAAYLIFQLVTHKYLYTLEASKINARGAFEHAREGITGPAKGQKVFKVPSILHRSSDSDDDAEKNLSPGTGVNADGNANGVTNPLEGTSASGRATTATKSDETAVAIREKDQDQNGDTIITNKKTDEAVIPGEDEEDEEEPQLKVWVAMMTLVVVTVFTGVTAEFLVSSIDGLTQKSHVNKEFVALILLPLVVSVSGVDLSIYQSINSILGFF
jgi:Ca2+:H+ antiporter